MSDTKTTTRRGSTRGKASVVWTEEERAAMTEHAKEMKAAKRGKASKLPFSRLRAELLGGQTVSGMDHAQNRAFTMHHQLSPRQVDIILQGGLLNVFRLIGEASD